MISKLGEELLEQKKLIASADSHVLRVRQENMNLKKRVAELSGDTLPADFYEGQTQLLTTAQESVPSDFGLPVISHSGDDDVKYTNQLDEEEAVGY